MSVLSGYYQPECTAQEIIEDLTEVFNKIKNQQPVIGAGDFNCRIDKGNQKARMLINCIVEEGFTLLNNPNEPTYICHNGRSTIDLIFWNSWLETESIKILPWFDAECHLERTAVLRSLHQARKSGNLQNLEQYTGTRRKYKNLLKRKGETHLKEASRRLIEDARDNSYAVLKPRKQMFASALQIDSWEQHFAQILNQRQLGKEPDAEQQPQPITFPEITIRELISAIKDLKNRKAAGPDLIYNEHLKQS
ncbi:hypothetical protein ANN_13135 [Periplaneta americana]|uniref:Endonuclease/exonuclease/phosphatase domain-containing protein n=1 Tax=Periplaneta americana TaxID=6978 RepID=A0ABQ8TIK0_PERAM|nr:hypothetical protein ANN_13135 [Periplaneta americana]